MRLTAQGLTLAYSGREIVHEVSLGIETGEMVAIVGPNGSGKTTLLKGMSRLLKPSRGRVLFGEQDIRSLSPKDVAKKLAILPQQPDTPPDLTVLELIWRGRYPHQGLMQRATRPDYDAVHWAMEATDTTQFAERALGSLSGGERQRAWIALALAQQPSVLLLDEPTSFLDLQHQIEVMHLLRRLNADGMTVVAVLHDLGLAGRFAERVIAVRDGHIEFDGPPQEVFTPEALERVFRVPIRVLEDPDTGLPIPIPRPDVALCPVVNPESIPGSAPSHHA